MQTQTHTLATNVALDVIADHARTVANSIVASVDTLKDHPTYTTKTAVRTNYSVLHGILDAYRVLAFRFGYPQEPGGAAGIRIEAAKAAVRELDSIPTGRRAR